mgnify:CR=1 FL=1
MFTPVIKLENADSRGEIYSISLPDDRELMLLHSKKGTLRGGHSHDVEEIVVFLTGEMQYHKTRDKNIEYGELCQEGDVSYNPVGEYHLGEFLEDTWLLEWKIGTNKNGWKNIDHEAWRERVKATAAKTDV